MVDKNAEAGDSQAADAGAKTTVFVEDEPPKEEWATYEVIENGELAESFKVPFTREEIDTVKFLLEKKNDPDLLKGSDDGCFSLIAQELHGWRNILAHGWLSLRGHNIEYDYEMKEGFKRTGDDLYINPKIYLELYLNAFDKNGRIWKFINKMGKEDLLRAQQVIKQKYLR